MITALALFLIPWQWIFGWVIASAFHELCHYIAIKLCRCPIWSIEIGIRGTLMHTGKLSCLQESFCAVAGPIGSFLLTFASPVMPRVAICGMFHFLYNLLPIYPLDGGRVIRGLLCRFLPEQWVDNSVKVISYIIVCCFAVFGIVGYFHMSLGLLPLIAAVIMVLKIKFPCKQRQLRVQ